MNREAIAAVATAPGAGAIAVVRMSGPGTLRILGKVIEGALPEARLASLRRVRDPDDGRVVDHCLVTVFPGPGSFTGEDVAEVSCHGGRLTPQLVLDLLVSAGARLADPGEFSRRAYQHGKLDLLQAEAIDDLIRADSPMMRESALQRLDRGLSGRVDGLREALIHLIALVSYGIDFPDEDEPPVPVDRIMEEAAGVRARIETLIRTAPEGERLSEGVLAVLAGPPNAGKSALFNALVGRERAIVTEIAGTTRDAIEAGVVIGGFPFRLVDTAGLRAAVDRVEGIGIEVAREYLRDADLILFCTEAGAEPREEERAFLGGVDPARVVHVATKSDAGGSFDSHGIAVSAFSGDGLDRLRETLVARSFREARESGTVPLVTRRRHRVALQRAKEEVERFIRDAPGVGMDLAETHLRDAVAALESLIGVVAPDDVLEELFGRFCVGK